MDFKPFNRLPPELRDLIWEFAMGLDDKPFLWSAAENRNYRKFPILQIKPPTVMHTCRESRALCLRKLIVRDDSHEIALYNRQEGKEDETAGIHIFRPFYPDFDRVLFRTKRIFLPFSDKMASSVEHLVLKLDSWGSGWANEGVWNSYHGWMDELPNLTSLTLVFEQCCDNVNQLCLVMLPSYIPATPALEVRSVINWWKRRLRTAHYDDNITWKNAAGGIKLNIKVAELRIPRFYHRDREWLA